MIVVDTSALMAILQQEPEAETFVETIGATSRALVGAPSAFEFLLVTLRQKGPDFRSDAEQLLGLDPIEIVPWTPELLDIATDALSRYGGRPARLNFGDCMAYALAKSLGAPLLYKGNDFAHTDIASAT